MRAMPSALRGRDLFGRPVCAGVACLSTQNGQTALAPLLMRHRAHMQRWGCRRTKKAEPTAAYSSGLVTRNLERWVMLASDWPIAVKKLLSVGR
mgnify:CR=1 FL=1